MQGRMAEAPRAGKHEADEVMGCRPGLRQARGFGRSPSTAAGRDLVGSGAVPVDAHSLPRREETALVGDHAVLGQQLDRAAGERRSNSRKGRRAVGSHRLPLPVR